MPLNLASVNNKAEERLLQIRTNPPSPQCFSAKRAPTKTTPSKASRSRPTVCNANSSILIVEVLFWSGYRQVNDSDEKPGKKKNLTVCSLMER